MAEGLGTGLQNLLQQFESAWHLQKGDDFWVIPFFVLWERGWISRGHSMPLHLQVTNAKMKKAASAAAMEGRSVT